MFVRDGRTLAYIPVTLAALTAIRTTSETPRDGGARRSYPHALAVYMALLECANRDRADRAAVTQRELGDLSRTSRSAVQTALDDLVAAGVLVVRERLHGGSRVENEYVIVEPERGAVNDTPARTKGDPRLSHGQLTKEEEEQGGRESACASKPDPRSQPPDGFPDELKPHAREVMRVLVAVAEQHGARKVWPLAVGRVVMAHPRHRLVGQAHALAAWAVTSRRIVDVVSTYRGFLERDGEQAATERLADDGTVTAASRGPVEGVTRLRPREQRKAEGEWATRRFLAMSQGASEEEARLFASGGDASYDPGRTRSDGGPNV
jgi:hypothetical protein